MIRQCLAAAPFALALALTASPMAAQAAQGLNGSYYTPPETGPGPNGGAGSVAYALSEISGLTPAATFTATTVCFPSCGNNIADSSTLSAFLGGNATNISPNGIGDLTDHVVVLTGYINVQTAGVYDLGLESDDGSAMWVNGALVANNDGDHGLQWQSADVYLNAGLTPIKILQFEDGGATGLTVNVNGQGIGGAWLQTAGVPEPATWAMMILGVGMIGAVARRRREGVAVAA